jgi:shikimate kinase
VDADVELETRTGRSVASWFADGEDAFRAAEAELLTSLIAAEVAPVIGAGGGVVVGSDNRARLRDGAVAVVYLHGQPAFLASRARVKPHRPLLTGDPVEVFERMYAERDGWYREVADAVVEVRPAHEAGEKPKWRLAQQVVEALVTLGAVHPSRVSDADGVRL